MTDITHHSSATEKTQKTKTKPKKTQKNGQPKSPKMPCVLFLEDSILAALVRVSPDE
jgi:hypothetical protein